MQNANLRSAFQNLDECTENKEDLYDSIFTSSKSTKGDLKIESKVRKKEEDFEDENIDVNDEENASDSFYAEEEDDDIFVVRSDDSNYDFSYSSSDSSIENLSLQLAKIIDEDYIDLKSLQEMRNLATKKVSKIQGINISDDVSYLLNKKFNWDYDYIYNFWLNSRNFREELSKLIKVPINLLNEPLKRKRIGKGECPICCKENIELYQMYCGHIRCIDCLKKGILTQIQANSFPVCCTENGCNSEIMVHEIGELFDSKTANNYSIKYLEHDLFMNKKYVKCPAPNCPYYLTRASFNCCNTGTCKCGKNFCMDCQEDSHAPMKCSQIKEFDKITMKMKQLEIDQRNWRNRKTLIENRRMSKKRKRTKSSKDTKHDNQNETNLLFKVSKDGKWTKVSKQSVTKDTNNDNQNDTKNLIKMPKKSKKTKIPKRSFPKNVNNYDQYVSANDFLTNQDLYRLISREPPTINELYGVPLNQEFFYESFDYRNYNLKHNYYFKRNKFEEEVVEKEEVEDDEEEGKEEEEVVEKEKEKEKEEVVEKEKEEVAEKEKEEVAEKEKEEVVEKEEVEDDDEEEDEEEEVSKFTIPPMNAHNLYEYKHWRMFQTILEVHLNSRENDSRLNVTPSVKDAIKEARTVLINSYKLLYFLNPSATSYGLLEYHVSNLEENIKKLSVCQEFDQNSLINACKHYIRSLLMCGNEINFMNQIDN